MKLNIPDFFQYIRRYGIDSLIQKSLKKVWNRYEAMKLKNLAEKDKINGIHELKQDFQKTKELIVNRNELPFDKNIKAAKEKKYFPDDVEVVLNEADHHLKNEFKIHEASWTNWQKKGHIDWHSDLKANFTWDKDCFYTYVKKTGKKGSDLKVPWQLSRFHFLFNLLFAFLYTGKKVYLAKIKFLITDWIEQNRPYYGVNWATTMEVSIRIANWSLVLYAIKDEIIKDEEFFKKFINSLWEHVFFISKNFEDCGLVNSNHYIANLSGFFIANILFPIFPQSKKWCKLSAETLEKELDKQVYLDGGYFESSTVYHCLVLELLFFPLYFSEFFDLKLFTKDSYKKLNKMTRFMANIIKLNSRIVQFGDNDSGRLFQLYNRTSLDKTYLVPLAVSLLKKNGFYLKEAGFDLFSFIFLSESEYKKFQKNEFSLRKIKSSGFQDFGVYILRNEHFYVAVSAIPNGRNGFGVHTHNDKLSFILNYKGFDIFVDPGTYVYTSSISKRNKFRSTNYHNTVQEDKIEQNDFDKNVFKISDDSKITLNRFDEQTIDLQHDGFTKKGGHIHRRKIKINEDDIEIEDKLESPYLSTAKNPYQKVMNLKCCWTKWKKQLKY